MNNDLKKIKGGASEAGSRDEVIKGFCDSDGQISAYADLSTTLRINIGSNGFGYSVLLADHVLFEGEVMDKIWAILGCCYPKLAEMIKALCSNERRAE